MNSSETILAELNEIEEEFQFLKARNEEFKVIQVTRNRLMNAYMSLNPNITGDAYERRKQVERVMELERANRSN